MEEATRVLLVDDDDDLLAIMSRVLEKAGYEVKTTQSPIQALEWIQSDKFHILVTDIVMPEMDGLDLLKEVKSQRPFIQVMIVTGYSSMQRAVRAMEEGADEYLLKPIESMQEFLERVKQCEEKIHRWRESVYKTAYQRNRQDR